MIDLRFYTVLHLLGIMLLFLALGGALLRSRFPEQTASWKRTIAISHGLGMLLLLVAGFGLLARLGISWPLPGWTIGKIVIWLILGGLIGVINRRPKAGTAIWIAIPILGLLAAYLAIYKPF